MEIIALKYGESMMGEDGFFWQGDVNIKHKIAFVFYLIKTQNKLILVDSGCDTMPGWEMTNFCGPLAVLSKLDILPEEITDVIITHSHHDHIESVKYYKNATIHIQKDEYVAGKRYIPPEFKLNLYDKSYMLCDGIEIVTVGGHSIGSSIVKIQRNGKKYLVCGDECYTGDCFAKNIPTGASVCLEKSKQFLIDYKDFIHLLCHDNSILPNKHGYLIIE